MTENTTIEARSIRVEYKNWRGETSIREIVPVSVSWAEANEWHPEPGWQLTCLDVEKGEERFFRLEDCNFAWTADHDDDWSPKNVIIDRASESFETIQNAAEKAADFAKENGAVVLGVVQKGAGAALGKTAGFLSGLAERIKK